MNDSRNKQIDDVREDVARRIERRYRGPTLGVKAISFVALILLLVGAVLSWYFLSKSEEGMISELRSRSVSLTNNLSRSSKWGLLSEDDVILDEIVSDILKEDSVLYVAISNAQGDIIASRVRDGESSDPIQLAILHARSLAESNGPPSLHFHEIDGVGTYHSYMPVESSPATISETDREISSALQLLGDSTAVEEASTPGRRYGSVQLLLSSKSMFEEIRQTFITGIALTILIILFALAISYVAVLRVLGPIKEMAQAASRISIGDLTQRIKVRSRDEVGVLATTFNHMSSSLARMTRTQADRLEELSALHEAGLHIGSTLDVEKVISLTLDVVVRRLGYKRALLFLTDWDRGVLTHGRVAGTDDEVREQFAETEIPIEPEAGFCARVALSGQPVLVNDAERAKARGSVAAFELLGPESFIAVPLLLEGQTLGVLAFESREARELADADMEIVETLANQMAVAIANAVSYQKIEQLNVGLEEKVRERTAELREQQRRLESVNAELVMATQHKSEFLANMSHELRTPLNAVIGYSELLQEEMEDEDLTAYVPDLQKIHSAGKHLLALINDVLDLSKIEAGKVEIYEEDVEVSEIVEEVCATVQPLIEARGNKFTMSTQPGSIRTDVTKLRQILFNLLSNAAKFTENGEITLTVVRETKGLEDEWRFRVSDTGIGIMADKMDELFEEFSQLDAEVARKHGGTGLGLAISQRFSRMMGGEITVESEYGKGSTFTATLPARCVGTESDTEEAARSIGKGRCEVLVIDDDPAVRDLVQRSLTKEGFRVATASGGDEGIERARQLRPKAITLDLLMPGVDGWSVLSQLKGDPQLADIPVIIVSILDDKDMGYTLGAADYLTKPVDQQRLASVIRQYCDGQSPAPILVIEDDADSRHLLSSMLKKEGWAVDGRGDAEAGLAYLNEQPLPALILLDLILPNMDGFEFVEKMHKKSAWRHIPVVVITAKDLSPSEHEFLNQRVQLIMKKGVYSRNELLDIVRKTMVDTVRHDISAAH